MLLPFVLVAALRVQAPEATPPANGPSARIVAEPRSYSAVRTEERMTIDGRADEAVWKRASRDGRFTERDQELGATPPVRTTIQVAYDDLALYFLVDCAGNPDDVVVRTLRRDSHSIWSDDTVTLKIDPNHDHRTAYIITINADGAQHDMMALENGKVRVPEWDAVWEAEATVHSRGWTTEFRIPFAILGVKSTDGGTMGLDVTRKDHLRNSNYDWHLIVPPQHPISASAFGELTGLRGVQGQRALEITPYALAQTDFTRSFDLDPRRPRNLAMGGEARVQVGTGSFAEASVFTDFAQVEVDEVQVARDQFPLFFPERRPFFINGLDVFNFGQQREAQLFFTRRVGLREGEPLPILSGVKAYGREGPISFGALNVQTLRTLSDEGHEEQAAENVSVARVRIQTTDILNVGVMAIGQHRLGVENDDSIAGGMDGQIISSDGKWEWYGFFAGTYVQNPVAPEDREEDVEEDIVAPVDEQLGNSAYSRFEYKGLYFRPRAMWLRSDEDFDPRMGFYRRPGTTRQEVDLEFVPRPRVLGLREIQFGPRVNIFTDPDYERLLTTEARSEIKFRWRNGSQAEYKLTFFQDDVQDPFELYLHTIDAGRYSGFRHLAQVESPGQHAVQVKLGYEYLELFGGETHNPWVEGVVKAGKHFAIKGRYTHLVGHFLDPGSTFNFGYANASLEVAFTRDLILDNLVRLDFSPGSERAGLQSRLRWRFAPGSDLFVVYRTDQPLGDDPVGEDPREPFHQLAVKLSFYLRAILRG
jgi:hypothetical protein